ncbi:restriction endonuclease fold toxin-2 domain-containing protein [Embleya hyalina]|uniref:restriction endonuclease fold toxin-2 domain-containing protein n=1 Tax=Embleya hyalina TaxID=516124 RepID=UPI000F836995|nr:restriction endonuclease fold toxin-2 domain-containing protein [Embleya hyalina]
MGFDRLVVTAQGFNTLREQVNTIANALAHDLGGSAGMAGDDGAGNAFAKVYQPAAAETVDQIAFAASVMGATSATVMRTAADYLATEDAIAAAMMRAQPIGPAIEALRGPAADPCDATGRGRELPHIVDEQGTFERVLNPSKGNRGKLSSARGSWNSAASLLDTVLAQAQQGARTMLAECRGVAMNGFDAHFKLFVGYQGAPGEPTECAPLIANLAAACRQIAHACERYAAHVKADQGKIHFPPKLFGGGDDLKHAVLSDPAIRALGELPPILNTSRSRVTLPAPGGGNAPLVPGIPPIPPLVPAVPAQPVPVALTSLTTTNTAGFAGLFTGTFGVPDPVDPALITPALPPPPGAPLFTPAQRADFVAWQSTLNAHHFANHRDEKDPDNAYQRRTAGYPEYDLPLSDGEKIQADGLRPDDGAIVEAKHVRNPDSTCRTETSLTDAEQRELRPWEAKIFKDDKEEITRYADAVTESKGRLTTVELHTNNPASVAYWQILMARHHTPGRVLLTP